jgi:hypothetical protein
MSQELMLAMGECVAAAFAAAAVVLLLCGWPWRAPRPALVSAGAVVAMGFAFYAGYRLIHQFPRWPPREAEHRLLYLLLPAALAVELFCAFVRRPRALVWLLRAAVAVSAGRVLLHDSIYLKDISGPDTAEWTPAVAALILGGMAAALAAVWTLLNLLMTRSPGRAVPLALALTCLGAALVTMLSGYASGGMLGMPLAAGLVGVTAGSLVLRGPVDLRAVVGPGLVGLFSLLVIGHFFSELTIPHAVLVFAAPLLCWLPELVPLRGAWPRVRELARVALVAIPIAVVIVQASRTFAERSAPSTNSTESADDEYSYYGK